MKVGEGWENEENKEQEGMICSLLASLLLSSRFTMAGIVFLLVSKTNLVFEHIQN